MTAIITPLPSGEALLDLGDTLTKCASWQAAADQADAMNQPWHLEPFPAPSPKTPLKRATTPGVCPPRVAVAHIQRIDPCEETRCDNESY